ncbi:MAG: crotonase/enoyl-CoA hydratase family protein [Gammaproteobacteria bacterium]|nr:crotonase/enoyl-CoA hydratase family protein [Gammaproteobacteria bacterium]MDH3416016.1 crotonase/enoyl-CoA hydratase family protein [Gammaproteobacteria bacterium]
MTSRVTFAVVDHVARASLNRPDKHNAIDYQMFAELADVGQEIAKDQSVRAVVLHGAGEHFCAGIDISVFQQQEPVATAEAMAPCDDSPANLFQRAAYVWREIPVPVICAIQGAAYGGGLQIALGADLRFAAPDARLSIMEIKWGLIPDMAISTTLRGIVPIDIAKSLAWSGKVIAADEALRLGLVTEIHDDPLHAADEMARSIANKSPDAIRAVKQLLNESWALSEADALRLEARLQMSLLGRENQVEAAKANMEGRPPEFSDTPNKTSV